MISLAAFARSIGVTPSAITHAVRAGRLTVMPGGQLDEAVARVQWEANRQRRPRRPRRTDAAPAELPAPAAGFEPTASRDPYWSAKIAREQAEADLAGLKAAELRGELVRRAAVEREVAGKLVALRESLEVLGDRLAALVAAESSAAECRRLIRDEHRKALEVFVNATEATP
jgi:hypothetical protein